MTAAQKGRVAVPYDFKRPSKFNRDHVRALQIANETLARQFKTVLSTNLRQVCEVTLSSVGQLTYDEFIRSVANPTYLAIISIEPLPGSGLFHIPLDLVMTVLDRMLGGPGKVTSAIRPLTDIEQSLTRELVGKLLKELTYAYESLVAISPRVVDQESNPQFAQVAAASDMVIVTTFETRLGDTDGVITLCLPFSSLQRVLDEVAGANARALRQAMDVSAVREAVGDRVGHAVVDVAVHFDEVHLTKAEIVDLRPGDVLPFGHAVDHPLTVSVAGIPYFAGFPGRRGKRLACVIAEGGATPESEARSS